jgi:DNA-binding protein H-NS
MQQNVTYASLMDEVNKLVKQVQNIQVNNVKKVIHTRRKPDAKYQDPISGKTWSGRGKTPIWMKEKISKGISKETFALNS